MLALSVIEMHGGCVEGADKVRISVTNPNMSFLPSGVALRNGFFKDEGLEVEIIRMNVPNIITALVTGDVGYTLIFGSVVRGALRGMPMRALASLLDGSTHALVAKPGYTACPFTFYHCSALKPQTDLLEKWNGFIEGFNNDPHIVHSQ